MFHRVTEAIFAFASWLFGARAAWIDMKLSALSAGWCALMVARPELFDRGVLSGLDWLPDPVWIWLMAALATFHAVGLIRPRRVRLRIATALVSAWTWLFVALSLARVEFTTGILNYALIGFGALFGAIYIAGLPRERA